MKSIIVFSLIASVILVSGCTDINYDGAGIAKLYVDFCGAHGTSVGYDCAIYCSYYCGYIFNDTLHKCGVERHGYTILFTSDCPYTTETIK